MKVVKVNKEERTVEFSDGYNGFKILIKKDNKPMKIMEKGFIEPGIRKMMNKFFAQAVSIIKG